MRLLEFSVKVPVPGIDSAIKVPVLQYRFYCTATFDQSNACMLYAALCCTRHQHLPPGTKHHSPWTLSSKKILTSLGRSNSHKLARILTSLARSTSCEKTREINALPQFLSLITIASFTMRR